MQRRTEVYATLPGYRPLELDIFTPTEQPEALRPAVVWIHGGAFAFGNRGTLPAFLERENFFERLTCEGFVVFSLDYRLSGEALWPAQLLDVRAAVRWVRTHAEELCVDADAIAVWGESAGGHLAAMAGVLGNRERPEEEAGLPLPQVAAVVDWYGPTDFALMDEQAPPNHTMVHNDPDSPESLLLGAPVPEAGALADDASPVFHVDGSAPPFFIRHGRQDRLVPYGQSILLADRLTEAGAHVDFAPVEGADHVFDGYARTDELVDHAIAFLHTVLEPVTARNSLEREGSR